MLAAVGAAKEGKKEEAKATASRTTRLAAVRKTVEGIIGEQQSKLLGLLDGNAKLMDELPRSLEAVRLRTVSEFTEFLDVEGRAASKALRDKDLWWKLKMETNRVATEARVKNLEVAHGVDVERKVRMKLAEYNESSELGKTIAKLEEAEKLVLGSQGREEVMEAQVREKTADAKTARRERDEIQRDLQRKIDGDREHVAKMIDDYDQELTQAREELARLKSQLEESEEARAQATARFERIESQSLAQLERIMAERDALQAEIDGIQPRIDALAIERDAALEALAGFGPGMRDAEASRDAAIAELNRLTEREEALRAELTAAVEAAGALEARVSEAERARDHAIHSASTATELKAQLDASAERERLLVLQNQSLGEHLAAAEKEAKAASATAAARAAESDQASQKEGALKLAISGLESDKATIADKWRMAVAEVKKWRETGEGLLKKVETLESHARSQPAFTVDEKRSLEATLEEAYGEIDGLKLKEMSFEEKLRHIIESRGQAMADRERTIKELEEMSLLLGQVGAIPFRLPVFHALSLSLSRLHAPLL